MVPVYRELWENAAAMRILLVEDDRPPSYLEAA